MKPSPSSRPLPGGAPDGPAGVATGSGAHVQPDATPQDHRQATTDDHTVPVIDPATGAPPPPSAFVRHSRALALGLTLGLIGLGLAWELWLAPTGRGTWAVKVLPLLPVLAGLWRYRLYTYRWLSLLVWLYVTEGLVRGPGPGDALGRGLAWAQVGLSVLLFVVCTAHIRWRLKHRVNPPQAVQPAR
jgi:uncharacterized membrane protein